MMIALMRLSRLEQLKPVDTLHATDFMDDGTEIKLALTIDRKDGSALFDFTGTGATLTRPEFM